MCCDDGRSVSVKCKGMHLMILIRFFWHWVHYSLITSTIKNDYMLGYVPTIAMIITFTQNHDDISHIQDPRFDSWHV